MRLSFLAAGIAVALFMSGGAKGIGTQAEGIVSGCVIGGTEGISNCVQQASCPIPTVTAVSPNSGSTAGGTSVTVSGTGFTGAILVNFGPTNPAAFSVTNPTTIAVASTPAGSAGTIDVQVTTPCGTSVMTSADHYTYTAAFVGIGDLGITNIYGWSGLRAYSAATAGTKAANVCNSGDANCADVNTLANGNFDVATAQGAPLNCGGTGGACTIKTRYEKSGQTNCTTACDRTNATAATRPTLVFNCFNTTLPCMRHASGAFLQSPVVSATAAQPITGVVVAKRTGNTSANGTIACGSCGQVQLLFGSSVNLVAAYAGGTPQTVAANDNALHSLQFVLFGASSSINVDGVSTPIATPGGLGILAGAGSLGVGPASATGNNLVGDVGEDAWFAQGLSSSDQTAVCHNLFLYYNTAASC